ncbi:hypothetical protein SEUCBS139899_001649 [Sporothrix eucalyptigena]|uniref:CENP-V/GFA domain-containing protein n=1 Tax=Sporothrix eucalyptigena TaxID=1812306 RepID=A0ABP0CJX8_9PEZI
MTNTTETTTAKLAATDNGDGKKPSPTEGAPEWHPIVKALRRKAQGIVLPEATYRGGCHCGAIAFDVTLSPPLEPLPNSSEPAHTVVDCSCSVCRRLGYLLVYPTRDKVVFRNKGGGQARCGTYQFNLKIQDHLFCKNCGSSVMIDFLDRFTPDFDGYGVNVRSLYNVDLNALNILKVDGEQGVAPAGDMSGQWYVESDTEE